MHVAGENLHRRENGRRNNAEPQRCPDGRRRVIAQDAVCRQAHQQERHREERCQNGVNQAIPERRIEDDVHPARHVRNAVTHFETRGRVHPGDQSKYPECGQTRAHRDEHGCRRVHPVAYALEAEQHNAEERRFQEERRQYLVGQQRPGDIADRVHEARPVGAELETHGDAANDAEGEGQREYFYPEPVRIHPFLVAGRVESQLEEQQCPGKRDGNHREQDMKADVRSELQT
jgi:hypothetical protein